MTATTTTSAPGKSGAIARAPHGVALAQFVLGLGGLFIGTGEFAAMGLLPDFATSVHVSIPEAGHLISAYALGVVVGSPLVAVVTAKMERRRLLVLLACIVCLGNLALRSSPTPASLSFRTKNVRKT